MWASAAKDIQRMMKVGGMEDLTRSEIDAKLALVEARSDIKFAELGGKIDHLILSIEGLGKSTKEVENKLGTVITDNKNTRWTIAITVVASTLAALAALWTTQSNLLGAFQTGLATRSAIESLPSAAQSPGRPPNR
jgi:hypothetical protein